MHHPGNVQLNFATQTQCGPAPAPAQSGLLSSIVHTALTKFFGSHPPPAGGLLPHTPGSSKGAEPTDFPHRDDPLAKDRLGPASLTGTTGASPDAALVKQLVQELRTTALASRHAGRGESLRRTPDVSDDEDTPRDPPPPRGSRRNEEHRRAEETGRDRKRPRDDLSGGSKGDTDRQDRAELRELRRAVSDLAGAIKAGVMSGGNQAPGPARPPPAEITADLDKKFRGWLGFKATSTLDEDETVALREYAENLALKRTHTWWTEKLTATGSAIAPVEDACKADTVELVFKAWYTTNAEAQSTTGN
jgi:hypothetical protein